jgi:methylmalonyl-CoA/ethylmalonyl-CoA epimerase
LVVLDLEAAALNFERRWGTQVREITEFAVHDVLYHGRRALIHFRRGLISAGASQLELTQPLSDSPFRDFLRERGGDGVHHLAYVVDEIDQHLARLKPTASELVLDATLPWDGSRAVMIDGFAHGPAIELIQPQKNGRKTATEVAVARFSQ